MLFSTVMEVVFRSFGSVAFWLLLVVVNVTTFPLIKLSSSIVVVIVVIPSDPIFVSTVVLLVSSMGSPFSSKAVLSVSSELMSMSVITLSEIRFLKKREPTALPSRRQTS